MATSPFAQVARDYYERGYSIIPCVINSKKPSMEGWPKLCVQRMDESTLTSWMGKAGNIALACGQASGVIAIDFDYDHDGLHDKIKSLIPLSPAVKFGSKGETRFYRHNGERTRAFSRAVDGKAKQIVEICSTGKKTILPPSIHPDTMRPYEWIGRTPLNELYPTDLPILPAGAVENIEKLFYVPRPEAVKKYVKFEDETSLEQVKDALNYISPDCDRETWVFIGMALKDEFGESAETIWSDWSRGSQKFKGHEIHGQWQSFDSAGIGIGTLFMIAQQAGYVIRHSTAPDLNKSSAPDLSKYQILEGGDFTNPQVKKKEEKKVKSIKSPATQDIIPEPVTIKRVFSFPKELTNPPGLADRICKWINETAIYPQPVLAVAATLAAMGAMKGHKIQSQTRLRTNLYTLGIAPSGAGKDHARKCIISLFTESGLDKHLGGVPASGAGLLSAVRDADGVCLIQIDEMGRLLKTLAHKSSGAHLQEITIFMIELFSTASSHFQGKQYANHDGKSNRKDINQPCLSIHGTTVPERFFQALTHEDAIDGFLSRWLPFNSTEYHLDPCDGGDISKPPQDLIEELQIWRDAPKHNEIGNLTDSIINPHVVPYAENVIPVIKNYTRDMRVLTDEPKNRRAGFSPVYSRCAEHAIKIALTLSDGKEIRLPEIEWAIAVTNHCAEFLCNAIRDNVSKNDVESDYKRLLRVIQDVSPTWITHSDVIKKSQWLRTQVRNEIILALIESNEIEGRKRSSKENTRPITEYRSFT